jgi:aminoglycoside phosphotransferase (APT) family kinase protein
MTQGSASDFVELIEMRLDERIDAAKVGAFLAGKLPGAHGRPEVLQFEGGKANLTYLLRYRTEDGGALEYVLRRPPLGPVAPKSHDMGREHTVLSRLYRAYPLAPRAFLFSEDPSVVGAPFLVMERRRGIVIRNELPRRFRGQPALCRRIGEMIVDALADLHAVEPEAVGLGGLGRPEGFMERQVRGWAGRWEAAKTEEVPALDRLTAWLAGSVPPAPRVSLVHNDFKLDNMMVDAGDPGRPVAVFDWDMCTLGDPLVDLGTLLGYWTEPGDSEARKAFALMPTEEPGFPTRAEVTLRYAARHGLDVSHIRWYEVFGMWKTAVVVQQIYVRLHRGQTQDERFRSFGGRVHSLVESARELAGL